MLVISKTVSGLSIASATITITRTDTNTAVVTAAPVTGSNGVYTYPLNGEVAGVTYAYTFSFALTGGGTFGVSGTVTAPAANGSWTHSNATAFIAQFGQASTTAIEDLDESTSNYLVSAGTAGDAYIDGRLRGMGLTLPLPALDASSIAWMQNLSNHAARWQLKDAKEIQERFVPSSANAANQPSIDKQFVDDQLAALERGLAGDSDDAVILYTAAGLALARTVQIGGSWLAPFAGIEAVPQTNWPMVGTRRGWWV